MSLYKSVRFFIPIIVIGVLLLTSSAFSTINRPSQKKIENQFPPHHLIGTLVSEGNSSMAILKDERTGKTIMLKEGESIYGLKLIQVFKERIILQGEEKTYQIFLGGSELSMIEKNLKKNPNETSSTVKENYLPKDNPSHKYSMKKEFTRSEVEKRLMVEWSMIMKETGFTPYYVNGKPSGIRLTRLPQKSILSETGILANDILKKINGIELKDMKDLFGVYNKLRSANRFEVSIERNRKLLHLLYILK